VGVTRSRETGADGAPEADPGSDFTRILRTGEPVFRAERAIRRPDVQFVPLDAGELRLLYGLAWSPEHASAELMALVQTVHEALRSR